MKNYIFINLSNHPTDKWSEAQKAAVINKYQPKQIIDIAFPPIDPEWNLDRVRTLVHAYREQIINHLQDKDDYIILHIMGEMCFTHSLVNMMSAYKVNCICSTTKRVVTTKYDDNGVEIGKETKFEFCKFRDYYYSEY